MDCTLSWFPYIGTALIDGSCLDLFRSKEDRCVLFRVLSWIKSTTPKKTRPRRLTGCRWCFEALLYSYRTTPQVYFPPNVIHSTFIFSFNCIMRSACFSSEWIVMWQVFLAVDYLWGLLLRKGSYPYYSFSRNGLLTVLLTVIHWYLPWVFIFFIFHSSSLQQSLASYFRARLSDILINQNLFYCYRDGL